MNEKVLDLSKLTDYEFTNVKRGYDSFVNGKGVRYFGAILNKKDLKNINREFNYVDGRSWLSGLIIGAVSVGIYGAYKRSKKIANEDKTEE